MIPSDLGSPYPILYRATCNLRPDRSIGLIITEAENTSALTVQYRPAV